MAGKGKERAAAGITASNFFSRSDLRELAQQETERQKRAFLNISRSGALSSSSASSSAALQPVSSSSASTSQKRPCNDHDENKAEDDEDEDDSSKNCTPLQRAAVGVITPTPATSLTVALELTLNQHQPLSHQKQKKASWVWAYFDKSKTVPKPALGANPYAHVCQVILDENRLCGKPITAELKPSTKALASHLTDTHGLRAPIFQKMIQHLAQAPFSLS
ncbi:hypothetical protein BDR26DRAFT_894918 [Obelidium mucronatum]|nr:hypothetical protein BDR26DRAFT_894918 [Obelidium mucronatum]